MSMSTISLVWVAQFAALLSLSSCVRQAGGYPSFDETSTRGLNLVRVVFEVEGNAAHEVAEALNKQWREKAREVVRLRLNRLESEYDGFHVTVRREVNYDLVRFRMRVKEGDMGVWVMFRYDPGFLVEKCTVGFDLDRS